MGEYNMDYIMLDIDGVLTGTINADLPLSQQALWFRLLCLAGKGHGRVGFVERGVDVGYSREALYSAIGCYKVTDMRELDKMLTVCADSNDPRIIIHDNDCIEIIKWDKYQYLPKGSLRDTAAMKARKKAIKSEQKTKAINRQKQNRDTLTSVAEGLTRSVNRHNITTEALRQEVKRLPKGGDTNGK